MALAVKSDTLVSIIIPTYRREESLKRTLESILRSTYRNLEIVIVDMGSSLQQIKSIVKALNLDTKYRTIIVKGREDMYVAGAINEGLKYVKGDYILICADDVVLEKDTIEKLVYTLQKYKDIGIVAPICYYLRDPKKIWWAGSKISMWTSRTYFYGRDIPIPDTEVYDTDSFTTIALIRKEVFYDESKKTLHFVDPKEFPIHNEEADFSFRARRKRWRVCVVRKAIAYHDIPPPDRNYDISRLYHVHTEKRAYYVARNRIIFHRKYSTTTQFLAFILIFNWLFTMYYLGIILFKSKKTFRERLKIAKAYLKGVVEGLKWAL